MLFFIGKDLWYFDGVMILVGGCDNLFIDVG